jgi:uncharacterized protein (DUF924 family)
MQAHPGWTLWDAEDISRIIRGLPLDRSVRIVDTFFPGWRDPFLGVAEPGPWLRVDEFFISLAASPIYNHDWVLVGRDQEMADILAFIDDESQRIGLIVGRGGIGKSKLLREVARNAQARNTSVLFLKPGVDLKPEHYELLPTDERLLVIVDDAHERSDLAAMASDLMRRSTHAKLLLALRPYGVDGLASEFRQMGLRIGDLPQFSLSDLPRADAEELAREALGSAWPRQLAERLGYLTADCPFITVVAGVLIRRGLLDPKCVDHEESIRKEVLSTFRDVVVADPISGDSALRTAVLDGIAALQPFRSADPTFHGSLGSLIGQPYDRAIRHIRALEDAGVLLRRGSSLRIVPDLLGDVILSEACFDDVSAAPTGYLERAWIAADGEAVQHIFVNANRIDWQIRHDFRGTPRITDALWDAISAAAQSAGVLGRINVMKLLQKVAYFEPQRSLELVRSIIENPTDVVEDIDQPLLRVYRFTHQDVLAEMPTILQAVAYNEECLRESANLLWALAATDRRETNRYPEHPLRILRSLMEIAPGKPISFNYTMIDVAADWFHTYDASKGDPSPFDVLEVILATEGSEVLPDGLSFRLRSYSILPSAVEPLRQRVLDLAFQELSSTDIGRAVRALEVIEEGLRGPIGFVDDGASTEAGEAWIRGFHEVLATLKETIATTSIDPVIGVALRRALKWHLDFPDLGTTPAAQSVVESMPRSLATRTAVAVFDGWGELLEGRSSDFRAMEEEKRAQVDELVADILGSCSDDEVLDLLETRLAAQRAAFGGRAGNPGLFAWQLISAKPLIGLMLCARVAAEPRSSLSDIISVVIGCLAEESPPDAVGAAQSLLATGDLPLRRAVARAFGWNRGLRATLLDGEFETLIELAKDEDTVVRQLTVTSAQRLATHHPAEAMSVLGHVSFADSSEIANEIFQSFTEMGPLAWDQFPKPAAKAMLAELRDCPSIEDYWIQSFLSNLSKTDSTVVVTLLRERVDHWEEVPSALEYRPLPFHWNSPLQLLSSPDFSAILRGLREWLTQKPDSWYRQDAGGRLFAAAVAENFQHPDVVLFLDETVVGARTPEAIVALTSILRQMPRDVFLSEATFATRVFDSASKVSQDAVERVGGAMHGAVTSGTYSGTPGQPFARDVAQQDQARKLADGLTPGSPEQRFYRSLERSAEESIRWHADRDEKLFDRREW